MITIQNGIEDESNHLIKFPMHDHTNYSERQINPM